MQPTCSIVTLKCVDVPPWPETNATAATPDATAGATTDATADATTDATADATTDATADATANATAGGFPDAAGVTVVCSFGLLLDIKEQADLSKILL
jgi:hypothetical protein